jgi:hypothetical protein
LRLQVACATFYMMIAAINSELCQTQERSA